MRDFSSIPKQKLLVENGEVGDCWRCCVAALMGMPAEEVPHFVANGDRHEADTQRWLNARGYIMLCGAPKLMVYGWLDDHVEIPVISCGPTPRSKKMGQHHAVVTSSSNGRVLYDPHHSNAGLTAITEQFAILKLP